ncbi:MAG: glycine cleavage T C-terminal barrel domain-containing protein, partial [Pseudomonadota bacterium]
GEIDPFYAHTLWKDDRPVGIVTSGAYGHRTNKVLALAYLRDTSARDDLTVSILGQHRKATILLQPPFDPENIRMKTGGQK